MLSGICARWKDRLRFEIAALIVLTMFDPKNWTCLSALKSNSQIFRGPFGLLRHWRSSNIPEARQKGEWARRYLTSVIVTVVAVALTVFTAAAAAFAFVRLELPGREAIYGVFLIGTLLPPPAIAIPLLTQLGDMHLLNSLWALILPGAAWSLAITNFIMRSYFISVRPDMEEAVRLDGAWIFQVFWHVAIPMPPPGDADGQGTERDQHLERTAVCALVHFRPGHAHVAGWPSAVLRLSIARIMQWFSQQLRSVPCRSCRSISSYSGL